MRTFRWGFAILGLLGALVWPADPARVIAASDDEEIEVVWEVVGCTIELRAPELVNLGSGVPGDVLESNPNQGRVRILSNCQYAVQARLEALNVPTGHPNPDGVRQRFEWKTANVDPSPPVVNLQSTYTTFPDFVTPKGVCESPTGGNNHRCDLQFRYTIDFEDVPGSYSAEIQVTASTP